MRRGWLVAMAVALVAGGVWYLRRPASPEPVEATARPTAKAERGSIEVVVAATGTVEPAFQIEVKSKASGEVLRFPLQPGDTVRKGEPLVELDPADEQRNVRRAQAEVASNEASLRAAEAELERRKAEAQLRRREVEASLESARTELEAAVARRKRTEDLFARKLVSPEALEQAQVAEAAARSKLALAEVALGRAELDRLGIEAARQEVALRRAALERSRILLEEAQDRLADTKIAAPIDGILLTKAVERGQIISSGISGFNGGTTLCTIADTSVTLVLANVDEADIGQVRPGQPVRVSCDAHRGLVLPGRVRRVLPLGEEEQNVVLFRVRIEVTGEQKSLLLPGMTANVEIVVDRRDNAVLVPNRALVYRDDTLGVELAGGGWKPVEVGITDGDRTAVQGIEPGTEVVLATVQPRERGGRGFFFGIGRKKTRRSGGGGTHR